MTPGTKVITISIRSSSARKGSSLGVTFSIGVFAMPQATYRQMPTGGEIIPMPTLAATRMPK